MELIDALNQVNEGLYLQLKDVGSFKNADKFSEVMLPLLKRTEEAELAIHNSKLAIETMDIKLRKLVDEWELEIQSETDDAGKKKFSNDTQRKAELRTRMESDGEYSDLKSEIEDLRRNSAELSIMLDTSRRLRKLAYVLVNL